MAVHISCRIRFCMNGSIRIGVFFQGGLVPDPVTIKTDPRPWLIDPSSLVENILRDYKERGIVQGPRPSMCRN